MKALKILILLLFVGTFFSGCLLVGGNSFKLDYTTGAVEFIYHDFRSAKGADEEDYSLENDWASLKESAADLKEEDADVLKVNDQEFFREGDTLSGKVEMKLTCPKCFPSKLAVLEYLHKDGIGLTELKKGSFQSINNEIFFFVPAGMEVVSTNGELLTTENNTIIVWSEGQDTFEYSLKEPARQRGTSLLPFYLEDLEREKEKGAVE